jgi:hypothetical protein
MHRHIMHLALDVSRVSLLNSPVGLLLHAPQTQHTRAYPPFSVGIPAGLDDDVRQMYNSSKLSSRGFGLDSSNLETFQTARLRFPKTVFRTPLLSGMVALIPGLLYYRFTVPLVFDRPALWSSGLKPSALQHFRFTTFPPPASRRFRFTTFQPCIRQLRIHNFPALQPFGFTTSQPYDLPVYDLPAPNIGKEAY